jgi:Protein of unknown function (DUF5672)
MLDLSNVTLLAIDLFNPLRTMRSMWYSTRRIKFGDVVLVTNRPITVNIDAIRIHNIDMSDDRINYERLVVRESHQFFQTPYCLFMEWDSFIANPFAWQDVFLRYDYVGAPWHYPFHEAPFPPCTHENCVGNGGFSLKSRDLCEALNKYADPDDPKIRISDVYICRVLRPLLLKLGLRFAPEAVAARFSCENVLYSGQFGIHGKWTLKFNGLDLEQLSPITGFPMPGEQQQPPIVLPPPFDLGDTIISSTPPITAPPVVTALLPKTI